MICDRYQGRATVITRTRDYRARINGAAETGAGGEPEQMMVERPIELSVYSLSRVGGR